MPSWSECEPAELPRLTAFSQYSLPTQFNRESFALESALSQEAENGRLMRLLIKMGYINERPEVCHAAVAIPCCKRSLSLFFTQCPQHLGDPMWSETGERYLLKLFRDYVFHQIDDEGKPILDVAHVIESLNKVRNWVNCMQWVHCYAPAPTNSWMSATLKPSC